eukprot:12534343-Alexandrium_andersonii.AAC.1
MSASLVGSEMCIRDRCEALYLRASAVGGVLRDWNREQWAASRKRGRETVSYTHLTLPTICSV